MFFFIALTNYEYWLFLVFYAHFAYTQSGEQPKYTKAWAQICEISRREFQKLYNCLGVHIEEKVFHYLYASMNTIFLLFCFY